MMEIINHDNGLVTYQIKSEDAGPHLLIFGAIHGDEHAGTIATQKLIKRLENKEITLSRGTLTLCPICNPKAYAADTRYIDFNLNRVFDNPAIPESYEASLVDTLTSLIDDCDYLLDIHSTHVPGDPAFTFVEAESGPIYKFAECLNVDNLFFDWGKVYKGEDYSTEAYVTSQGKIGVTIECGYHKDENAATIAHNAIYNALDFLEIVPHTTKTVQKTSEKFRFTSFEYRADGDMFVKEWTHMDPVNQNDPIFKRKDGSYFNASIDGFIFIPNKNAEVGDEFFFFGTKA